MTYSGPGAGAGHGTAPAGPSAHPGPPALPTPPDQPGPPAHPDPADGAPGRAGVASIANDLRAFLASVTGRDELLHIPPGTALFGTAVGLDSLTGTLLLREIQRRFGVDVAGEDLNLDSLATLGTLAAFVAQRARPGSGP